MNKELCRLCLMHCCFSNKKNQKGMKRSFMEGVDNDIQLLLKIVPSETHENFMLTIYYYM